MRAKGGRGGERDLNSQSFLHGTYFMELLFILLKVAFTFVALSNVLLICTFRKIFWWKSIGLQRIIYSLNFGREKGGMDTRIKWKIQVVLVEWILVQWPLKLWRSWIGPHCCGCHRVPAVTWLQFWLLACNCNVTASCDLMLTICNLSLHKQHQWPSWQEVAIGRICLTTATGTSTTPVVSWSGHITLHFALCNCDA